MWTDGRSGTTQRIPLLSTYLYELMVNQIISQQNNRSKIEEFFFYVKQVYNSCVKENQTFCFKVELG